MKYAHFKSFATLSSALLMPLLATSASRAEDVDAMKRAQQYFAASRFEEASGWFKTELTKNPNNASAHYMLGVCSLKTHKTSEAASEFAAAQKLDPNGTVGKYSQKYLQTISPSARTASTESPSEKSATSDENSKETKEEEEEVSSKTSSKNTSKASVLESSKEKKSAVKSESPATETSTTKTAAKIGKDSTSASSAIAQESEQQVSKIEAEANTKIAHLTARAEKTISEMVRPQYKNYGSYYEAQAVREECAAQVKRIKEEAEKKVAETKELYRQKQNAVEDSALSMHRSYQQKNQYGKIILSPVGTSMHVRNYQTSDEASGNAVPVLATPGALPLKKK